MKRFFWNRIFAVAFMCACALVLGSKPLYAIEHGDIVTISYINKDGKYLYLGAFLNMWGDYNVRYNEGVVEECLWKVTVTDNQYSFQNISATSNNNLNVANTNNFQLAATASAFTFEGNNDTYKAEGKLRYGDKKDNFVKEKEVGKKEKDATNFIIEKWERKDVEGGLKGEFLSSYETFGLAQTDTRESKTVQFKITREVAQSYYYCLNREDAKINLAVSGEVDSAINLELLTFGWLGNNKKNTSRTTCSNFEDDDVKTRDLLSVSFTKESNNIWNVSVTAEGSSPMNLKDINENWIDYSDELVASFRETNDPNQTTHTVSTIVRREAYHRKERPIFPVNASPMSYTFGKTGGEATIEFSCWHQHGADIIKSDDQTKAGEDVSVSEENVTNVTNITFTAKSTVDETTVNWLKVESINNGKLVISATDNSLNGTKRYARLVGVFTYTNPNDATDTHTKTIEIPITQNFKDGKTIAALKLQVKKAIAANPEAEHEDEIGRASCRERVSVAV